MEVDAFSGHIARSSLTLDGALRRGEGQGGFGGRRRRRRRARGRRGRARVCVDGGRGPRRGGGAPAVVGRHDPVGGGARVVRPLGAGLLSPTAGP